jgi:hypothetical protein
MKQIRVRAFRAIDDFDSCKKFEEGHRNVLENLGVKLITSANIDWFFNPDVFVIVAESLDKTKIYGGAKMQFKGSYSLLPIEIAVGKIDSKIYDIVKQHALQGTGEFCGLWNSIEVAGLGISSIFLVRVGVARAGVVIANQMKINSIFALCASYTVPIAQRVGFTIEKSVGNEGTFPYPTENRLAVVTILKDPTTLISAKPIEREHIFDLRSKPQQQKTERGLKGMIHVEYDIFMPSTDFSKT